MMREVPVRDTDPDPAMNNNQEEDRSSPIAFTVDFGAAKGSCEEKSRRLERFVQKSSQRRAQSPLPGSEYKHHQYLLASRRQNSRDLEPSFSQEIRKDRDDEEDDCDDYVNDKFETESDKSPSETGTYTVDKDEDTGTASTPSLQLQEARLSSLASNKTSYVEEWATKHAFPVSSQPECFPNSSRSPDGTKSSLNSNKSRRLLPATPHMDTRPGESLQFSPDSEQSYSLTPPNLQESEDESSYVSHTQHLVEVMEERIKQKNLKKLEIKSTRTLVSGNVLSKKESKPVPGKKLSKSVKSPEPHQDAMEAWKRRKNYNPMAAAGRARVSESRKQQQEERQDTSESESASRQTNTRQTRSAPAGGKTRGVSSSRSSTTSRTTTTSTTPLRRLAHTNSSSSLQGKSNRSSSSLTSKEAEFQAWKRRKDYDPRKAAARPSSSRKVSSSSRSSYSEKPRQSAAKHKKLSELSSSAMSKSLIIEEMSDDSPIQRSNSFHCNAKKNGRHHSEEESEEDYCSGYDSSLAESQIRSYPHYYLDDDELILPIQSSHSNMSHRSLYNKSPQVSPNKSRSKLEALDSLVISTIHNVSNKLCSSSAAVLRQAALVFPEQDEDKASTLETVIYLLEDLDLPPSPAKKTSRELSGTLRNLKKIEQSMEMMKKLLGPDADEEED